MRPIPEKPTVKDALNWAREELVTARLDTPQLDAELLLAGALGMERERLILLNGEQVDSESLERLSAAIARRADREPVAYVLGRRAFRYLELEVDRRVLIPRPETELLVEVALSLPESERVIDVGTGSGAVALALKHERPDLAVLGSDLSQPALAVAEANAVRLGLAVKFFHSDLLEAIDVQVGAVVSNLPYVSTDEYSSLAPEIIRYEPSSALVGGSDGLDLVRRLIEQTATRNVPFLALEIGDGQAARVRQLCEEAGFTKLSVHCDLAGIERVVVAQRC